MVTKMTVVSIEKQEWADQLGALKGIELVVWDMKDAPPRDDIELVVPPYMTSPKRLRHLAELPALRAVQVVTAGYEHAVSYLPTGVELANGKGIHNASTAELAVGLAIAAQRGIDVAARNQMDGNWDQIEGLPSLADRQVLLVGYGQIGHAIARRLEPFEAQVTAVASHARAGDEHVDRIHGIDELDDLLPSAEVVILILPLTDATHHLVDEHFLSLLPDNALVVNVARGGIVDTDALVAECASGRLRAALDVTDPEPLPADHPLWRTRGVLITPHIGGASSAFEPRAIAFLKDQLAKFAAGDGLDNVVVTGS